MKVKVLWPNGETNEAPTARQLFESLLGGWNPWTVDELKIALARRANIEPPDTNETDIEFLYRLDKATLLCVQMVNDDHSPSNGDPRLN